MVIGLPPTVEAWRRPEERGLRQADVRCRRVFRIWSRPLLQGSGLLSVDKRDSEPGPAVCIA